MIVGDCKPTYKGQRYDSLEEVKLAIIEDNGGVTRALSSMNGYLENPIEIVDEEFVPIDTGEEGLTINNYTKEDILYDPMVANNLLKQIPVLKGVAEEAEPVIEELERRKQIIIDNLDPLVGGYGHVRAIEVQIPEIFANRLLHEYTRARNSTAERKQKVLNDYKEDVKKAKDYIEKGITDEDIVSGVLALNQKVRDDNAKTKEDIAEAERLRNIRETSYQAALPFIDWINSVHPGPNGVRTYESQTIGGFLAAGKISKENMFKMISLYNEMKKDTGDAILNDELKGLGLKALGVSLFKRNFDLKSIFAKGTTDLFANISLDRYLAFADQLEKEAAQIDFKEGNISDVPVPLDDEVTIAERKFEELKKKKDDIMRSGSLNTAELSPITNEMLKLKEFINTKKGISTPFMEAKKKALEEFKKALKDVKDSNNNLGFAYDPKADAEKKVKLLTVAVEVLRIYFDEGVTRFADIVKDAMELAGDYSRDFLNALKKAYAAEKMDGVDLPDSFDYVNSFEYGEGYDLPGKITQEQKEKLEEVLDEKKADLEAFEEKSDEMEPGEDIVGGTDIRSDIEKIEELLENGVDYLQKFTQSFGSNKLTALVYMKKYITDKFLNKGVYSFEDIIKKINEKIDVEPYFDFIKMVYDELKAVSEFSDLLDSPSSHTYDSLFNRQDPKEDFIKDVTLAIKGGEKLNIVTLRRIASVMGLPGDIKDTTIQEYVEFAIVQIAREIAFDSSLTSDQKFKKIVELYQNQPTISMRSNEQIDKQQYSTPVPMGFVMGEFIKGKRPESLLEPSAGNGMLVYSLPMKVSHVNELDAIRRENLVDMGFNNVTGQDAMLPFNGKYDAVMMNPPFGSYDGVMVEGKMISGKDPLMVINALNSMKDNGRAAIIIGGNHSYTKYGGLSNKGDFFQYLYNRYNVVDVINMKGDLYSKQGTSFPTRMILIDGRRPQDAPVKYAPTLQSLPPNKAAVVESWEELYNRVKSYKDEILPSERPGVSDSSRSSGGNRTDNRGNHGVQGSLFNFSSEEGGGGSATNVSGSGTRGGVRAGERSGTTSGNQGIEPISTSSQPDGGLPGIDSDEWEDIQIDILGNESVQLPDGVDSIDITQGKVDYKPQSKATEIGSKIPVNMASPMYSILRQFGDIDAYVQNKLRYATKEDLYNALAAEQIDSVAMAIYQIDNNNGFILGDATGVGKGRQCAAIIRYGVLNGKKPVFVTEKDKLFSDMHKDLTDIGCDYKPFIVNNGPKSSIVDVDNPKIVYHKAVSTVTENQKRLSKLMVPDEYDYVVATYSQFSYKDDEGANTGNFKKPFLEAISKDNIFIFDESHNMSSAEKKGIGGSSSGTGNTAAFFRRIIPNFKGGVFSSATFAKRPGNMPVYALKTAISKANMVTTELINAILKGGVPLQEIMSANLAKVGQLVRRERDFTGVKFDWKDLKDQKDLHEKTFDTITDLFRDIIDFQRKYVDPVLDVRGAELAGEAKKLGQKGTKDFGVSNVPFASRTFNAIRQLLFSLTAEDIANQAIEDLKAGRKVTIAVANTMESFLKDLGLNNGDVIGNLDFAIVLQKGIDSVFKYQETEGGVSIKKVLPLTSLSPAGRAEYARISAKINTTVSGITISPIDHITTLIQKAGYKVGELTGRDSQIRFLDDGKGVLQRRTDKDKNKLAADFNSGALDVLIINQSGSTGISLHASSRFKDKRQRVMLMAQAQLDVNIEIQMMGRIDRTGQKHRGIYRYFMTGVPAQKRMLMMLKSKLKSLNANTSGNQESDIADIKVVDFINKYGDIIVKEYLFEHPEINEKMLDPLGIAGREEVDLESADEDAANKVTGKAALLTVAEQEDFYNEVIERYESLIQYLDDTDSNDLVMKTFNLEAETLKKDIIVQGADNSNPFSEDTYIEEANMNIIKKPMKSNEVIKEIKNFIGGEITPENLFAYKENALKDLDVFISQKKIEAVEKARNSIVNKEESLVEKVKAQLLKEASILNYTDEQTEDSLNDIDIIVEYNKRLVEKRPMDGLDAVVNDIIRIKSAESIIKPTFQADHYQILERGTNNVLFAGLKFENEEKEISKIFTFFTPGKYYRAIAFMDEDTNGMDQNSYTAVPAVFLGFSYKPNSLRLSTTKAIFATKDGRRKIQIPLSQKDVLQYMVNMGETQNMTMEKWDSGISENIRKKGYIITGNLIQSYGVNRSGQLISYTKKDGSISQGILMPDSYNPEDQKLRVGIDKVADTIRSTEQGVFTTDGEVSIMKTGYEYTIKVPLSNRNGSKYYSNPELQTFVKNGYFSQSGQRMEGKVSDANLDGLLKFLFTTYNSMVNIERKTDGPKMKNRAVPEVDYNTMVDDMIRTGQIKQVDLVTEKKCN